MVASRRCLLGLGSNLGNRLANLQDVLRRLAPAVDVQAVSSLYESDPVGPAGQPPYLNAACAGVTTLEPADLLREIKSIEWALGRRLAPRWGPRPVDIDILAIDDVHIATPALTIPHPRIDERPFVLLPLAEVAPELRLEDGRTVAGAARVAGDEGLRLIAGQEWRDAVSVFAAGVREIT